MGETRLEKSDGTVRLVLSGSFRIDGAAEVKQAFVDALAESPRLVVDLSGMESADLSLYQLLCSARRSALAKGGELATVGVRDELMESAARFGLTAVFDDRCMA